MSQAVLSNSTTASRRLFLVAGTATAVSGSLRAATTDSLAAPSSLAALIEAHKAALLAFEEICDFDDHIEPSSPAYPLARAERNRLSNAEEDALFALCAFRPTAMAEVHLRGDYLADFLERNQLEPDCEDALIGSFRSIPGPSGVPNTLRSV